MLRLKVNGKKHKVYTEFEEITLTELRNAYTFLEGQDFDIKEYFKDKEANKVKESRLLDFKISWINLFSDIEINVLKNVRVEGATDLSIEFIFTHVEKFLYMPEKYAELKEFKHKGKVYKLVEETETISGAAILFGQGNYNQWKLSNMLSNQIQKGIDVNTVDSLVQLTAVLYTHDGDNSDKAIEQKIREFKDLDALTGWSSYFFFALLLDKWKSFFHSYTERTGGRKTLRAHKILIKEQLLRLLCKTTFGASLKLSWLNYKWLIMDWKE